MKELNEKKYDTDLKKKLKFKLVDSTEIQLSRKCSTIETI